MAFPEAFDSKHGTNDIEDDAGRPFPQQPMIFGRSCCRTATERQGPLGSGHGLISVRLHHEQGVARRAAGAEDSGFQGQSADFHRVADFTEIPARLSRAFLAYWVL